MPADSAIRVLVCSGNLGNAAPDPASLAAWIPQDGCLSAVVDHPKHPLPSAEECASFFQSVGIDSSVVSQQLATNSNEEETPRDGAVKFQDEQQDDEEENNDWFDIIVIGMQEATFSVEEMEKNTPEIIPLLQPFLQKAARKVKKEANKGISTVNTLTADKNLTPKAVEKTNSAPKLGVSNILEVLSKAASPDSEILRELIADRLPSYDFAIRYQRGEMRLEVLVRKELEVHVEQVTAQNTGLGGVGANKGGIVGVLKVNRATTLAFCTAHLEAHEGNVKYKSRCAMLQNIFEGTADDSLGCKYDLSLRSHFSFVLGDLNFRTELSNHEELSKQEHNARVRKLVQDENWLALNQADELFRGLRDKDLAVGFQTLPCYFPPTFKLERAAGYNHKEQRRPSYTDRILWKCAHELDHCLKPLVYEPIDAFCTSDHKPIRGAFEIQPNQPIKRRPSMMRRSSVRDMFRRASLGRPVVKEQLHIYISNLRCRLKTSSGSDAGTNYNPYVAFLSNPEALVKQDHSRWSKFLGRMGLSTIETTETKDGKVVRTAGGWPRTRKLLATDQPDWGGEQVHLVVNTHDRDGLALDQTGSILYFTVIDHKSESLHVVGTFALNLAQLCLRARRSSATHARPTPPTTRRASILRRPPVPAEPASTITEQLQDAPLLKHGKERGTISCTMDACWIDDAFHDRSKSLRQVRKKSLSHKLKRIVSAR